MQISFFVAIADNGVIGHEGTMPWKLSGDMAHLKRVTMGKPLIMGRKTWDSLPKKPLPGRPHLVVTRDEAFDAPGAETYTDAQIALERAKEIAHDLEVHEVIVFGGAQIYAALFDHATRIYLTEVHATPQGDVSFPAFDPDKWREVSRERHEAGEKDSSAYSFVVLERDL